jgi:hypothetical protein
MLEVACTLRRGTLRTPTDQHPDAQGTVHFLCTSLPDLDCLSGGEDARAPAQEMARSFSVVRSLYAGRKGVSASLLRQRPRELRCFSPKEFLVEACNRSSCLADAVRTLLFGVPPAC